MNKQRRNTLQSVIDTLENVLNKFNQSEDFSSDLDDAYSDLEICCDEEQESVDNLPDNFMFTQRYDDINDNVADLEEAKDNLDILKDSITEETTYDDIESDINEIIESINNAIER